jgi:hypothetical protein
MPATSASMAASGVLPPKCASPIRLEQAARCPPPRRDVHEIGSIDGRYAAAGASTMMRPVGVAWSRADRRRRIDPTAGTATSPCRRRGARQHLAAGADSRSPAADVVGGRVVAQREVATLLVTGDAPPQRLSETLFPRRRSKTSG